MILQAGFDLGTFSILFNRTYSRSILDATGINTAVAAGRYSQPAHLRHFDGLKTEPEKLCFLEIAASIWHEKRHFFDTLLTNYGALRTRHYFHVIGYANALIDELRASGMPLLLPIEIYADKIRRSQFGVEHVPEVIERVAKAVSSRQQLFDVDSMPWRGLQLGGDAQLEALAFYSQLAAVQVGFGLPALQAMQRRLALHGGWQPRYRWVEQVTAAFDIDLFLEDGPPGMRALDMPLVSPLLIASLMVRAYNQEPVSPGEMEKLPAGRLARFSEALAEDKLPPPGKRDVLEMWSLLNRTAEKLWGRSIENELAADFEKEGQFLSVLVQDTAFAGWARLVYDDVHRLRGELIALLEREPRRVLDPIRWSIEILPQLDPLFIELFPAGQRPASPQNLNRSGNVLWAGLYPRKLRFPGQLSLRQDEAWKRVHAGASPLAKLLISGRCDPWMIGPEQDKFERDLAAMHLQICVEPYFASPAAEPADAVFQLTHSVTLPCRACGVSISRGSGRLVSAWTIKKHRRATELPGTRPPEADWAPWLLCDGCASILATE